MIKNSFTVLVFSKRGWLSVSEGKNTKSSPVYKLKTDCLLEAISFLNKKLKHNTISRLYKNDSLVFCSYDLQLMASNQIDAFDESLNDRNLKELKGLNKNKK